MKFRLFTSLAIPHDITASIAKELAKVSFDYDIRFIPQNNWHITISFLGEQNEDGVVSIRDAARRAAERIDAPDITLTAFMYGPPKGQSRRMLWVCGDNDSSHRLETLRDTFYEELGKEQINFKWEDRRFQTHATVARFEPIQKENVTPLDISFSYSFTAYEFDVMSSQLGRDGSVYTCLDSFAFREDS